MEVKEAVGKFRKSLSHWQALRECYGGDHGVDMRVDHAIPVAETLLAALERIDLDVLEGLRPQSVYLAPPAARLPNLVGQERPLLGEPTKPTILAGRDVHGWGWKVFRKRDETLSSESEGKGSYTGQIPQGTWLNYLDWASLPHCSYNKVAMEPYPLPGFHIFRSEAVAKRWKQENYWGRSCLVVQRIAWRGLRKDEIGYVGGAFRADMFTAEQIYILPEEGMPIQPAERPPEKGDWVVFAEGKYQKYRNEFPKPCRVVGYEGEWCRIQRSTRESGGFMPSGLRIVRRAADPLRVGDRVAFGSEKGWVIDIGQVNKAKINFSKNDDNCPDGNWGWLLVKDLTLVEPHYEPKGDC